MIVELVSALAGVALTVVGVRGVLQHGRPIIETNDPTRPKEGTSTSRASWLYGGIMVTGGLLGLFGFARYAGTSDSIWLVLLLAGVLLVIAVALDLRSTMMTTAFKPEEPLMLMYPSPAPIAAWVTRFIAVGFAVMALRGFEVTLGLLWAAVIIVLLWLLPTVGVRYLHNRSRARGEG